MNILADILPIFFILLLGYTVVHFRYLESSITDVLTKLVFYVVIPPTFFIEIAKMSLSFSEYAPYMSAYFCSSMVLMLIAGVISKRIFRRTHSEIVINVMGCTHTNTAYLAIPIFLQVFHEAAPVAAVVMVQVWFTMAFLIGLEKGKLKHHQKSYIKIVVTNPMIVGIVLGVVFNVFSIHVPSMLEASLWLIRDSATFLALFTLGSSLADKNLMISKHESKEMFFVVFMKSFIHPLMGYTMGKLWGVGKEQLFMLLLICAMPTAKNLFIFSQQYQVGTQRSNWIVFWTTVLSLFSIPLIAWYR